MAEPIKTHRSERPGNGGVGRAVDISVNVTSDSVPTGPSAPAET
jgi:hypothetical protein